MMKQEYTFRAMIVSPIQVGSPVTFIIEGETQYKRTSPVESVAESGRWVRLETRNSVYTIEKTLFR